MLPIKPIKQTPVVIQSTDWNCIDKKKLVKTYKFDLHNKRLAFVVQIISSNDQHGERFKIIVDGLTVIVGIQSNSENEFIGDRERKHAKYADEIYRDICRYATRD